MQSIRIGNTIGSPLLVELQQSQENEVSNNGAQQWQERTSNSQHQQIQRILVGEEQEDKADENHAVESPLVGATALSESRLLNLTSDSSSSQGAGNDASLRMAEDLPSAVPLPNNVPSTVGLASNQYLFSSLLYPYPTTKILILWMHLIFLYQWKSRRTRRQTQVSYRILVQRKEFHRIWGAILSHPPKTSMEQPSLAWWSIAEHRRMMQPSPSAIEMGGPLEEDDYRIRRATNFPLNHLKRLGDWIIQNSIIFRQGPLSGVPLLVYNSHILWTCSVLESEHYHSSSDPMAYARVLLALAVLTTALDLMITYRLLTRLTPGVESYLEDEIDSSSEDLGSMRHRLRKTLLLRPIGTTTAVSTALLLIHRIWYPHEPTQILPFIPNLPFMRGPSFCCGLSLLILGSLWRHVILDEDPPPRGVHHDNGSGVLVVAPILCMFMSAIPTGVLWASSAFIRFVGEPYYGYWLMAMCALASMLSLKNQSPSLVPCVDAPVDWHYGRRQMSRAEDSDDNGDLPVDAASDFEDVHFVLEQDPTYFQNDSAANENDAMLWGPDPFPRRDDDEMYPNLGDMLDSDDEDDSIIDSDDDYNEGVGLLSAHQHQQIPGSPGNRQRRQPPPPQSLSATSGTSWTSNAAMRSRRR